VLNGSLTQINIFVYKKHVQRISEIYRWSGTKEQSDGTGVQEPHRWRYIGIFTPMRGKLGEEPCSSTKEENLNTGRISIQN
jgi:hypothetical protein